MIISILQMRTLRRVEEGDWSLGLFGHALFCSVVHSGSQEVRTLQCTGQ